MNPSPKPPESAAPKAGLKTGFGTGADKRKPWIKKTPVEVVKEQVIKQRKQVAELEEALKQEKRQLQKLEEALKVLEAS